jgi:hypothetical protein
LEPTLAAYIATLVDVFREVRRVLRADGTVFLNVGDSFYSGGTRPNQSRPVLHEPAYGTNGTEPSDSPAIDSACPRLCDGCRAALSLRIPDTIQPDHESALLLGLTGRDTGRLDSSPASLDGGLPDAPASTSLESSQPPPGECWHCDNCDACLSVLGSSLRDARLCARTAAYTNGNGSNGSAFHNRDMDASALALGEPPNVHPQYTANLKPKDLMMVPARLAIALCDDGWWVRSDCIWHKRAPMPESVTDRPTSAHEHVFLLTKSPRYFYDADAVREPYAREWNPETNGGSWAHTERQPNGSKAGHHSGAYPVPDKGGANLRNVWTLSPEPFSGAALGGTSRTVSPDCPVHGYQASRARARSGDGPQVAFGTGHSPRNGSRRVPLPVLSDDAIPASLFASLSDGFSATSHSTQSHRTAGELAQGVTSGDTPDSRIACMEPQHQTVAEDGRTLGSSTGADAAPNGWDSGHAAQTSSRIADTQTRPGHASGAVTLDYEPRTAESSTSADSGQGASSPLGQTTDGSGDMQKCSCPSIPQDHYAVFPTEIPRRAIKAGTSERGCCAACGAPWKRVVERTAMVIARSDRREQMGEYGRTQSSGTMLEAPTSTTTGWEQGCACNAKTKPCTVLDPFAGAGTTGLVADEMGRDCILVELNPEYAEMARSRIYGAAPMFAAVEVA